MTGHNVGAHNNDPVDHDNEYHNYFYIYSEQQVVLSQECRPAPPVNAVLGKERRTTLFRPTRGHISDEDDTISRTT